MIPGNHHQVEPTNQNQMTLLLLQSLWHLSSCPGDNDDCMDCLNFEHWKISWVHQDKSIPEFNVNIHEIKQVHISEIPLVV